MTDHFRVLNNSVKEAFAAMQNIIYNRFLIN